MAKELSEKELLDIIIEDAIVSERGVIGLSHRNITELPAKIGQLVNLRSFVLNYNQLTQLPESIGQLDNLQILSLENNQLTSLPESIGDLINLQTLRLSSNQLTHLPEAIGQLVNLRDLTVWGNQLTSLPESIGDLINLQTLRLSGNQLTHLPETISQLVNLEELSLNSFQLTNVLENICDLPNLRTFSLHNNQLTSLPESIGDLVNLRGLFLGDNQLTSLPESIGQLINLGMFDLSDNQLVSLPESLCCLDALTLFLDGNPLSTLPPGLSLQALYLNRCRQLTTLPDDLTVTDWIGVADSGLQALPASLAGVTIYWRQVQVDERIAFQPETITAAEIMQEQNAELRRVLLERMGFKRFMQAAQSEEIDRDTDAGGVRRLLRIPIDGDEDFVGLVVIDPSTGRQYVLRVPPHMESCQQAAAWIAGFDDPDDYRPLIET